MTQTASISASHFSPTGPCTVYVPDMQGGWQGSSGCDEAREIFHHLDLVTFHEGPKTFAVLPHPPATIGNPLPAAPGRLDERSCQNWTLWGLHKGGWSAIGAGARQMRELEEEFALSLEVEGWLELRIVPPGHAMPASLGDASMPPLSA